MSKYLTAALYQFVSLPDCHEMRAPLYDVCRRHNIFGTLLLAHEGINGTIAGLPDDVYAVLNYLKSDVRLATLEHKESWATDRTFYRMKVKVKREIVTMGLPEVDPNIAVGTYVKPEDWNALISDPDVLVLDTRNDYEVQIGTFTGAVDPNTTTFREFPEFVARNLDPTKNRKVAMFCTGGIRCEKASSYLKMQGFDEVYHLQGGILKYLEVVPPEASMWEGECFVFDQRVAVTHGLGISEFDRCFACRMALSPDDLTHPQYEAGVSCHHCVDSLTDERRASLAERQKQVLLAEQRGEQHIGRVPTARMNSSDELL
jgi:UPF0176 protein